MSAASPDPASARFAVHRIAVYFLPAPEGSLARAGADWLGGRVIDDPPWPDWLSAPARYGFHATLKAPFRLADGLDPTAMATWVRERARRIDAFTLPPLEPVWFGDFLALRPRDGDPAPDAPLRCLADECVAVLEPWRAPLTAQEVARRRPERLSAEQARLLRQWGYPGVFDAWRFHMTLSGPAPPTLDAATRSAILAAARAHFASALAQPILVDAISLCVEASAGQAFRCWRRVPLRGAADPA
ncbi:MAG: DUF1045 domain-containing protein [Burkholderiaceae bacterium]